ncbi:MAG: galactokinase [Sediminibacterium sp.]|jgi:galactokinase|nr:galactokinase [Chitinophagaceae bacterium]MCA6448050.1 galactokinase [Chitinophagaceae bacterium]
MIELLKNTFSQLFKEEPSIVFAPGRINIIGEHTDYNDGYVLPAAIDKGIYIAANRNADGRVNLFSIEYNELYTCSIAELSKTSIHWVNYVLGAIIELKQRGYDIQGFNAVITSNLPVGAGVSSSAALTSATLFALNQLFSLGLGKTVMAKLAQQVEHHFAGVNCGIMDMFTSLMGKENHAIQLDCRDLSYSYVPINLDSYVFVLMNTNVKHSLASTAYNQRRKECEAGVALVKSKYPEVRSLRDISLAMLTECIPVTSIIHKRCSCIVNEIARVVSAVDAISKRDLVSLGSLLYQAHDELSHLYEVSCKELDYLVGTVQQMEGVMGARMMGGGFGGCTLNLIHKDFVSSIITTVKASYEADCKLPFDSFIVSLGDGAKLITN